MKRGKFRGDPLLAGRFFSLLDIGFATEADLASYLMFDGTFCRQLIEMGRSDAQARRDELLAFFGDPDDDKRHALQDQDDVGTSTTSAGALSVPGMLTGPFVKR